MSTTNVSAFTRPTMLARGAVYVSMLLASLSYNFSFILIDYVRPFLVRLHIMSLPQTAMLYSCQSCGIIIGSILLSPLVARLGPKAVLVGGGAALIAGNVFTLHAASFAAWATWRFLIGVALAGSYVASITLLANFFPAHLRARLLAFNMSMFSVALLLAGAVGVTAGAAGPQVLLGLGALLPALVVVLTLVLVPPQNRYVSYGNGEEAVTSLPSDGNWRDMLHRKRRTLTLSCVLLAGLNFCGYQFYSGFITSYLLNERHFSTAIIGWFVLIDGIGTLFGSLLWGSVADRLGRRVNAIGFGFAAVFIGLFLAVPPISPLLLCLEFGYAVCLSASNCWAAYFVELFAVRLRPMGSALYHLGHVISLAAPLVVATIARMHSLAAGMTLAPVTFAAAALLWWSLPETLRSSPLYRGFNPQENPT